MLLFVVDVEEDRDVYEYDGPMCSSHDVPIEPDCEYSVGWHSLKETGHSSAPLKPDTGLP